VATGVGTGADLTVIVGVITTGNGVTFGAEGTGAGRGAARGAMTGAGRGAARGAMTGAGLGAARGAMTGAGRGAGAGLGGGGGLLNIRCITLGTNRRSKRRLLSVAVSVSVSVLYIESSISSNLYVSTLLFSCDSVSVYNVGTSSIAIPDTSDAERMQRRMHEDERRIE